MRSPPPEIAAKIRVLAERLGWQMDYPDRSELLAISTSEIERYALEVLESNHLDWRVWPGFAAQVARGIGRHVSIQFARRAPYGLPDAPANPLAITGKDRERQLRSFAGSLRHRGLEADELAACLLVLNDSRCVPPLSELDVANIARSMQSKPAARPLGAEAIAA